MLTYKVLRPQDNGLFMVGYQSPGECSVTVACMCRTEEQAQNEAARLNVLQFMREKTVRWDRELRGLDGVYPALEAV